MMYAITVPAGLWTETQTAVIGTWFYADGEIVAKDAVIVELVIEKTSFEIQAPVSGTLHINKQEEEEVLPGENVGYVDT